MKRCTGSGEERHERSACQGHYSGGGKYFMIELQVIEQESRRAAMEICEASGIKRGEIFVVGCSSSEVLGDRIGTATNVSVAEAIYSGIAPVLEDRGVYLAGQCCEHLNRAIIIEHEAVPNAEIVNVVPQPKAGGSFATACYASFKAPVALEHIKANAGIDIGGTLIGMHLREVAVPVRLKQNHIGKAIIIAARTRPKFIGGERAHYNEALKDGYPEF